MTKASCHTCAYACWDLGNALRNFSSGFPNQPMCANHPEAPGLMRATPVGNTCRNFRPRPATPEGDVKRIPLAGGAYAYVDAADYEWLSQYRWYVYNGGYAARREKGKVILMHREIMQPPEGMVVDHIDINRANNCRFNLRVCTPAENQHNHAKRTGSYSQFKGVGYHKDRDRYYACFKHNGQRMWLGLFDDEVDAARAYDHRAVECCGPFARVNLPEEWPPERVQQVYAEHQAGLKREGEKGAKGVKGEKVRTEEGKSHDPGKGRGREGNRGKGKRTTPHAGTPGRRTGAVRRKRKPARAGVMSRGNAEK
jgi:hypothetical protein